MGEVNIKQNKLFSYQYISMLTINTYRQNEETLSSSLFSLMTILFAIDLQESGLMYSGHVVNPNDDVIWYQILTQYYNMVHIFNPLSTYIFGNIYFYVCVACPILVYILWRV